MILGSLYVPITSPLSPTHGFTSPPWGKRAIIMIYPFASLDGKALKTKVATPLCNYYTEMAPVVINLCNGHASRVPLLQRDTDCPQRLRGGARRNICLRTGAGCPGGLSNNGASVVVSKDTGSASKNDVKINGVQSYVLFTESKSCQHKEIK